MKTYYQDANTTILHGDCIETMRGMPADSVDSIVTDPPYGLGFMGKKWDALPPGEEWAQECLRVLKPGGHILAFGGTRTWHRLAVAIEDAGFEMRDSLAWHYGSGFPKHRAALKPAFEPVVMARKPFKGSLTTNEAIHGTGALNIDECRIGTEGGSSIPGGMNSLNARNAAHGYRPTAYRADPPEPPAPSGRWPANVILDEHTADLLDEQSGASRFFYVAKAPKSERPVVDGVAHPTVKPLALMRWLCKLVTPEGGTILDTFAGSGTTIEAALIEGYNVIGIERETDYLPLIQHRINRANGGKP